MSKKSLIKRILGLGRAEEDLTKTDSPDVGVAGGDMDVGGAGEAALRPSIADILFKRQSVGEEAGSTEKAGSAESVATKEDALAPEQAVERRLSKKEETAQKLSDGLDGMTGLLKSIKDTLETTSDRNRILADSIDELPEVLRSIPEASRAQIEFLGTISKQLDLQSARSVNLADRFEDLPEVLKSIPDSQREQAGELRSIASQLSENSLAQIDQLRGMQQGQHATLAAFQSTQNKSLNLFHKAQQQSLAAFKNSQRSQSRQMQEYIYSTHRTMSRMLIAGATILGVALAAMGALVYFS